MKFASIASLAAAATLLASPLAAEPWVVDKSHAHVSFEVSHLGFSTTQGVFREFDAQIDFDPENMETASVAFTIQSGSVDTFWEARDKHIRSADFLDADNHPEITFTSKSVRLIDDDTAEVVGDVTIKGVTNEETFTAQLLRLAPSPFNPDKTVAGFVVEGEIDRTKYGVAYGAPAIGVVMPVRVDLEISPAG